MADLDEVVLLLKICALHECRSVFYICKRCFRGHSYCSDFCRDKAQLRQHREANRRYQQSPEGRADHRDREHSYRERRKQRRVTDHSSLPITCPPLSSCGPAEANSVELPQHPDNAGAASPPPGVPRIQPEFCLRCRICGRQSRFIDQFPRTPRRRRVSIPRRKRGFV